MPSDEKQYGVTPPISLRDATPLHRQCDASMRQFLLPFDVVDSALLKQHREHVVTQLYALLLDWIGEEYRLLGHASVDDQDSDDDLDYLRHADSVPLKLCTFGSYRLGVNAADGDIDLLCVGPSLVSRERFFDVVGARLDTMHCVRELVLIRTAAVPVISMVFHDVALDVLYAPLDVACIHQSLSLLDDRVLLSLDDQTQKSLNGSRVTDTLLDLVPCRETFREALIFVKFWATRRGIYSNVLGFLGGISWAILTARVCQLFPQAAPSFLVLKLFELFGTRWQWPNPVLLAPVYTLARPNGADHRVWDASKHPSDQRDLMPILTPSFPAMNSTHNVTRSTLRILKQELRRGYVVMDTLLVRQQVQTLAGLTELCRPATFFEDYKHYLRVQLCSDSADHAAAWKGFVQSKLRMLVVFLDHQFAAEAWCHPSTTVIRDVTETQHRDTLYMGLRVVGVTVLDLSEPLTRFRQLLCWDAKTPDMALQIDTVTGKVLRKSMGIIVPRTTRVHK